MVSRYVRASVQQVVCHLSGAVPMSGRSFPPAGLQVNWLEALNACPA